MGSGFGVGPKLRPATESAAADELFYSGAPKKSHEACASKRARCSWVVHKLRPQQRRLSSALRGVVDEAGISTEPDSMLIIPA